MRNVFFKYLFVFMSILNFSCDIAGSNSVDYHNKILFTSNISGKEQLYIMDPDGMDIIQITSGKYWHNNGSWSPDAQKILCNTEEKTTTAGFEMVVFSQDGSNRVFLGWGGQMSWYSNSKILYSYAPLELGIKKNKLYSIDINGDNSKVLSEIYVGKHTISPDRFRISFTIVNDSLFRIVELDYPGLENPRYVGPSESIHPCYSPDGNSLVFSKKENQTKQNDIYIYVFQDKTIKKITNNTTDMQFVYPIWSPKGNKILFLAHTVDGSNIWNLFMVDIEGSDLHKVIDDNSVTSCDWSR
jgi:Tol biopolymer transport system component